MLQIDEIRLKICPKSNLPTLIQILCCEFLAHEWKKSIGCLKKLEDQIFQISIKSVKNNFSIFDIFILKSNLDSSTVYCQIVASLT